MFMKHQKEGKVYGTYLCYLYKAKKCITKNFSKLQQGDVSTVIDF